jgi:hypothetical protein
MMTFWEFLEAAQTKRVAMYGIGKNKRMDSSRSPGRLGVLFKAVNPADLGVKVVWNMQAGKVGQKPKTSGVIGK